MQESGRLLEQVDKYLRDAGVPKKYLRASLATVDEDAWALGSVFLKSQSVYLWGDIGVGKSCLATLLLKERINMHLKKAAYDIDYVPLVVLFAFVPELILKIKSTWKPSAQLSEMDIIKGYQTIPILFLDDLGVEETHEIVIEKLTTIIDYRSREEKLTIFTSNLDLQRLGDKLGDRLASRIAGMCAGGKNVIKINGADRRLAVQGELALCR